MIVVVNGQAAKDETGKVASGRATTSGCAFVAIRISDFTTYDDDKILKSCNYFISSQHGLRTLAGIIEPYSLVSPAFSSIVNY